MTYRRECPVCQALLVAPALFCEADWRCIPDAWQQMIGEAYVAVRVAQSSRSTDKVRAARILLLQLIGKGADSVRAFQVMQRAA